MQGAGVLNSKSESCRGLCFAMKSCGRWASTEGRWEDSKNTELAEMLHGFPRTQKFLVPDAYKPLLPWGSCTAPVFSPQIPLHQPSQFLLHPKEPLHSTDEDNQSRGAGSFRAALASGGAQAAGPFFRPALSHPCPSRLSPWTWWSDQGGSKISRNADTPLLPAF